MTSASQLRIPAATQKQFGELITLILGSESMNDEERQYWVNILPAMTPAQQQSLRDILVRERQQLQAIDSRYKKTVQQAPIAPQHKKRRADLSVAEAKSEASEESTASQILDEIDTIGS